MRTLALVLLTTTSLFATGRLSLGQAQRDLQPRLFDCRLDFSPPLSQEECDSAADSSGNTLDKRSLNYGTRDQYELTGLPSTCAQLEATADLTSYSGYRAAYLKFVPLRTCGALRFLRKAKPATRSLLLDMSGKLDLTKVRASDFNLLHDASSHGVSFSEEASYEEVNRRMAGTPDDTKWTGYNIFIGFTAFGDIDGDGFEDGLLEYRAEILYGHDRGFRLYVVSLTPEDKLYRLREFELTDF